MARWLPLAGQLMRPWVPAPPPSAHTGGGDCRKPRLYCSWCCVWPRDSAGLLPACSGTVLSQGKMPFVPKSVPGPLRLHLRPRLAGQLAGESPPKVVLLQKSLGCIAREGCAEPGERCLWGKVGWPAQPPRAWGASGRLPRSLRCCSRGPERRAVQQPSGCRDVTPGSCSSGVT